MYKFLPARTKIPVSHCGTPISTCYELRDRGWWPLHRMSQFVVIDRFLSLSSTSLDTASVHLLSRVLRQLVASDSSCHINSGFSREIDSCSPTPPSSMTSLLIFFESYNNFFFQILRIIVYSYIFYTVFYIQNSVLNTSIH